MPTTQKYSTDMLKRIAKAIKEAESLTDDLTGEIAIAVALVDSLNANDLVVIDAPPKERDEPTAPINPMRR